MAEQNTNSIDDHYKDLLNICRKNHFAFIVTSVVIFVVYGNFFFTIFSYQKQLNYQSTMELEIDKTLKESWGVYNAAAIELEAYEKQFYRMQKKLSKRNIEGFAEKRETGVKQALLNNEEKWIKESRRKILNIRGIMKTGFVTDKTTKSIALNEKDQDEAAEQYKRGFTNLQLHQEQFLDDVETVESYTSHLVTEIRRNSFFYEKNKIIKLKYLKKKLENMIQPQRKLAHSLIKTFKSADSKEVFIRKGWLQKKLNQEYEDIHVELKRKITRRRSNRLFKFEKMKQVLFIHQYLTAVDKFISKRPQFKKNLKQMSKISVVNLEEVDLNFNYMLTRRTGILNEVSFNTMRNNLKVKLEEPYTISGISVSAMHILPSATIILTVLMYWFLLHFRRLREVGKKAEKVNYVWFVLYHDASSVRFAQFTFAFPALVGAMIFFSAAPYFKKVIDQIGSPDLVVPIVTIPGLAITFLGFVALIQLGFALEKTRKEILDAIKING